MLKLIRVTTGVDGTFGVLVKDGVPLCVTLELPWKDNERNVSCIPEGSYEFCRVNSPRFGNTFQIAAVPGRSNILFHAGNTIEDTSGCILLGTSYGFMWLTRKMLGVRSSKLALRKFMRRLEGKNTGTIDIIST